jgi:hypothetical protein
MSFDNARAETIYETAIYAALTEGQRDSVSGGVVYRLESGPWRISFSLRTNLARLIRLSCLKDRSLEQELQVSHDSRTVFRALGTPVVPRDQQMLAEPGDWEEEFMERWGALVHWGSQTNAGDYARAWSVVAFATTMPRQIAFKIRAA